MRRTLRFALLFAGLCTAPFVLSPAAQAQASASAAAPAVCEGTITTIRISDVKPGKLAMFRSAVAAHQAWYRKNGIITDRLYVARVLVQSSSTGVSAYSDNELATFHVNPPTANLSLPRNDEDWKAFVKLYRDSSDIKAEYSTCTPNAYSPGA